MGKANAAKTLRTAITTNTSASENLAFAFAMRESIYPLRNKRQNKGQPKLPCSNPRSSSAGALDSAAFGAGSDLALLAGVADGGDAAAYAVFALLDGVPRLVGQIVSALRDIVAGFLAAHGREQDTQTKSYS